MDRRTALLLGAAAALAACAKPAPAPVGSDGKPLPQVYAIKPGDESAILYRMLDAVNVLRQSKGAPQVQLNAALIAELPLTLVVFGLAFVWARLRRR